MSFDRSKLPDSQAYFQAQGLVLNGPLKAKWKTTSCEFHGGSDSLRINVSSGAWVCMSCGEKGGDILEYEIKASGIDFKSAAKKLNCWIDDGKEISPYRGASLGPRDALSVMAFEATLAAVAACNLANGIELSEDDRKRLLVATNRINRLVESYK